MLVFLVEAVNFLTPHYIDTLNKSIYDGATPGDDDYFAQM